MLQVKTELLAEYKERHRSVWPEMILETEDFERARARMASREVNERWQREMSRFFVQPQGLLPDQAMAPLEEVFHI